MSFFPYPNLSRYGLSGLNFPLGGILPARSGIVRHAAWAGWRRRRHEHADSLE